VFVCPVEPAPELEALLLSARFENNVQYITGSPLVSAQFAKARPYDADAVFTLTSQFEEDSLATDASAVLTVKGPFGGSVSVMVCFHSDTHAGACHSRHQHCAMGSCLLPTCKSHEQNPRKLGRVEPPCLHR